MLLLARDELSGTDFGQEEERVGYNTGGEYQVTMMIVMITMMMMMMMCSGQFAGRSPSDRDVPGGGPGQRLRGGRHIPGSQSLITSTAFYN